MLTALQSIGATVFTSSEYSARGRSDTDFVYDLYKAYLFRDPDSGGWTFWTGVVASAGRDAVRDAFATSGEFIVKANGCSPYSPLSGYSIPRDGWEAMWYDSTTNHVAVSGFTYDSSGNQTVAETASGGWQRFQYDAANRLVNVYTDSNVLISSTTYGADNQRLVTDESGTRTYYSWAGDSVVCEYTESDSSSSPVASKIYVYLGNRLLSTLTPNGAGGEYVEYDHPDRLGTRMVTNATDTNYYEQTTTPFGNAMSEAAASGEGTGSTTRRFTTYDRSSTTGLDHAVNRHYDPLQGRFTQVDPIGAGSSDLANPQSFNLYSYCGNDPVNRMDPSGLFWGFLKNLLHRIIQAFIHAVVVAVIELIMSGGNIYAAAAAGVGDFLKEIGWPTNDWLRQGTPPFNPVASPVFNAGVSGLNRYIIVNFAAGTSGGGQEYVFQSSIRESMMRARDRRARRRRPRSKRSKVTDPCGPQNWKQVLGDYRTIGSYVGITIEEDGHAVLMDSHASPLSVVSDLKRHGFSWFLDLHPAHFGYADYEGTVDGRWYHVSVAKSSDGEWPKGIDPITIHCESFFLRPSGLHRIDWILKHSPF